MNMNYNSSADAEVEALYGAQPGVETVKAIVALTHEELAAEQAAAMAFAAVCSAVRAVQAARTDKERASALSREASARLMAMAAFKAAGAAHEAALGAMLPPR